MSGVGRDNIIVQRWSVLSPDVDQESRQRRIALAIFPQDLVRKSSRDLSSPRVIGRKGERTDGRGKDRQD